MRCTSCFSNNDTNSTTNSISNNNVNFNGNYTSNVCDNISVLNDELCNLKVNLAASKTNLLNLVRIMCMSNGVCAEEKEILAAIECNLNAAERNLATCKCCAKTIDKRLC